VRKNRTLTLTRDAADYLPAIRTAFEDLRRATERLQRPEREALLTVSTTTSLAVKWLVTRIASFQDAHPGIEVRLTTSSRPVDFQRDEVDMAVRYGRGNWPGLRAQWLMPEDVFPVCSPALINGPKLLRRPEDLVHHTLLHTTVGREDWQLWLTAAGLPVSFALRRGLSFDQSVLALQAAIDGLGGRALQKKPRRDQYRRRPVGDAFRRRSADRRRLLHRRAGGDRRHA
jgi:LysR family transcriptional regulator, glycine cleavage system transcriptional activator